MHNFGRNHQLYLAERCLWIERLVEKNSIASLIKIIHFKQVMKEGDPEKITLVKKLIKENLLSTISSSELLVKEGFFEENKEN
jgi:hypothetical protein